MGDNLKLAKELLPVPRSSCLQDGSAKISCPSEPFIPISRTSPHAVFLQRELLIDGGETALLNGDAGGGDSGYGMITDR